MIVLIGCNTLKREENQKPQTVIKTVIPEYTFPEIPELPYAVRYFSDETPIEADYWIVPGSYLKALDAYFEQIVDLELKYDVDKEIYNGE
jgi:hypothetical protein